MGEGEIEGGSEGGRERGGGEGTRERERVGESGREWGEVKYAHILQSLALHDADLLTPAADRFIELRLAHDVGPTCRLVAQHQRERP